MPIIKLDDLGLHVKIDANVPFDLNSYAHAQAVRVLNGLPADRGVQVILHSLDSRAVSTPLAVTATPDDVKVEPEKPEVKNIVVTDPDYPKYFKKTDDTELRVYNSAADCISFSQISPNGIALLGFPSGDDPAWEEITWAHSCIILFNWHTDKAWDAIKKIRDYHEQFYEPPKTQPIVGDTLEMVCTNKMGRITAIDSYIRWDLTNTSRLDCHLKEEFISAEYGPHFRVHKRITPSANSPLNDARVRPWSGDKNQYFVYLPKQKYAFGVTEPNIVRAVGTRRVFEQGDKKEIFNEIRTFVIRTVYNSKAYLQYVQANKLER